MELLGMKTEKSEMKNTLAENKQILNSGEYRSCNHRVSGIENTNHSPYMSWCYKQQGSPCGPFVRSLRLLLSPRGAGMAFIYLLVMYALVCTKRNIWKYSESSVIIRKLRGSQFLIL